MPYGMPVGVLNAVSGKSQLKVHFVKLCPNRKYLYPSQGGPLEIARERVVSKVKLFEGKYQNWNS